MAKKMKTVADIKRTPKDIPASEIVQAPWNPRQKITKKNTAELIESIRTKGLIHRIDVIENTKGGYTAIAGNRRLFACQELGIETIPCDVCDIDEVTAREITLAENINREGADPFKQADNIEKLIGMGQTVEEIAASIGFGIGWVYRHKQLVNIDPRYRDLADEKPFTLDALEKISRYDRKTQEAAFESVKDGYYRKDDRITWDDIAHTFNSLTLNLNGAKFDTEECLKCRKNTANEPLLFDLEDDEKPCSGCGKCQDKECYKKKYNEWLEAEKEKLEKKYGKLKHYKNSYQVPGYPSDKKTKEHPIPYTTEDYNGTVKIVWGQEAKKDEAGDLTPEERKAERERKRAEKAARELHNSAIAKMHSWLEHNVECAANTILDPEYREVAKEIITAAIIKAVNNYDDDMVITIGKAIGLKVMDLDEEEIAAVTKTENEKGV